MKMTDEVKDGSAAEIVESGDMRVVDSPSSLRSSSEILHLPDELIREILGNLAEMADRVRAGLVCKRWRSALSSAILPRVRHPWLLLRPREFKILKFCSISTNKTLTVHHNLDHGLVRSAPGTSDCGWLLVFDFNHRGTDPPLYPILLNPITGAQISLPKLPDKFHYYSYNISFSPKDGTLVVMIANYVANHSLLCCRFLKAVENPSKWTMIPLRDLLGASEHTVRFTYHQGHYFILRAIRCSTSIVDPRTNKLISVIPPPAFWERRHWPQYLVQSSAGDELFLIITPSRDGNKRFEVFRWDSTEQENRWSKVTSIGRDTFFMSRYSVMALPTANSSPFIRENCIVSLGTGYGLHLSLFDIGNDSVERLPCSWIDEKDFCSSQWFAPGL